MNRFALVAGFVVLTATSQAALLFSSGFEGSEGFVPGAIGGQVGWDAGSDGDMSVVNTMAHTGTNSLLINTDSAGWPSGSGWSWPNLVPAYNAATRPVTEKVLKTSAHFFIQSGVNDLGALRRYGFDAYTPTTSRIALIRMRSDNGKLELLSGVAGSTVQTSAGSFARDGWNKVTLVLDYINNIARALVNDVDAGISAAIDGTTQVNDVDVYAVETVPAGGTSQGVAFVDNYTVEAVPEPATMAALGLGVAAALRRRRK